MLYCKHRPTKSNAKRPWVLLDAQERVVGRYPTEDEAHAAAEGLGDTVSHAQFMRNYGGRKR